MCNGRLILSLEGGYTSLRDSVASVLSALTGSIVTDGVDQAPSAEARSAIRNTKYVYGRYWPELESPQDGRYY